MLYNLFLPLYVEYYWKLALCRGLAAKRGKGSPEVRYLLLFSVISSSVKKMLTLTRKTWFISTSSESLGESYGLNGCVLPNLYVDILMHHIILLGGGALVS